MKNSGRKPVDGGNPLRPRGIQINGVRLDSGNLAAHAFKVRVILLDKQL